MSLYQNRIVVKVGTSTLTNDMGKNDLRAFDRLACVLSDIQNMGYEVVLVSSGAIALGANKLQMKRRPESLRMKQAAAAVGQCRIMHLYDNFFNNYDKAIAQILLNAEVAAYLASGAGSRRGICGIKTKLQAAKMATSQGIDTIVINGKKPSLLYEIIKGSSVGTLFMGKR